MALLISQGAAKARSSLGQELFGGWETKFKFLTGQMAPPLRLSTQAQDGDLDAISGHTLHLSIMALQARKIVPHGSKQPRR